MATRRSRAKTRNAARKQGSQFIAVISVRFKPGVLDPQGQAILSAAHSLGFSEITGVRVGKIFDITVTAPDAATAREKVSALARDLLANPVIESFTIDSLSPA